MVTNFYIVILRRNKTEIVASGTAWIESREREWFQWKKEKRFWLDTLFSYEEKEINFKKLFILIFL